jgi:hypothetical protein
VVDQPEVGVRFGPKSDDLRGHQVADVLAEQLAQDRWDRWLGVLAGESGPDPAGVGVQVQTPGHPPAIDPPGQLLARPPRTRPHSLQITIGTVWPAHHHSPSPLSCPTGTGSRTRTPGFHATPHHPQSGGEVGVARPARTGGRLTTDWRMLVTVSDRPFR